MGKFATKRRKKRKFSGNRFTKRPRVDNEEEGDVKMPEKDAGKKISSVEGEGNNEHMASGNSASFGKLQQLINERSNDKTFHNSGKDITGFRLCDMGLIADVFCLLKCPECDCVGLSLEEDDVSRKGCASKLRLCCQNCDWKHLFWTSKRTEKSFEVNKRLIYGMRRIGKGHAGASKFCSLMNMPSPLTAKSFRKSSRTITQHVKKVAKACMKSAAEEVCDKKRNADSDDTIPVDCGVSCDGSWQRRGHSSLNGCVTIISMDTGKVLDVEALTSHCKECKHHEKLEKNSKEYRKWKAKHTNCNTNYQGSAPAMEPEGASRMFERSVEVNNLQYTDFYGDGDSKSFSEVKNTYPGIEVQKQECIGHVQKRVGTALRKLKKDNPGLGGKGKLTNAMIDKLQNYYDIAVRSNVGDLGKMAKAIHASLFHCASSDANPYHTFHCPPGSDSWCRYQQDKANGTKSYKHGPGLPKNIIKLVKPVFQRLSDNNLLEKCLHGKTQNQNEALNALIWQRIPKEVFVHRDSLEFGVYDAVLHFNIGCNAIIELFKSMNIPAGKYTELACQAEDKSRVLLAQYKSTPKAKKRRKVIRGLKKKKEDQNQEAEGLKYGAGEF